jgi:hypothetical protein
MSSTPGYSRPVLRKPNRQGRAAGALALVPRRRHSPPRRKEKGPPRSQRAVSRHNQCAIYSRRFGLQWGPSMSFSLSDTQVAAITGIAQPLAGEERRHFMAALLEELLYRRKEELGDGSLARLLRELQRRHFAPPAVCEMSEAGYRPGPRTSWTPTSLNAMAVSASQLRPAPAPISAAGATAGSRHRPLRRTSGRCR